jgi:hypothetical protein
MSFQPSPTDVSVIVTTPGTATGSEPRFLTERRVTPTWTVLQLKSKLETMTGIPTNCQHLLLKAPGRADQWVDGDDSIIGNWGLMKGCEIEVCAVFPSTSFPLQQFVPCTLGLGRSWLFIVHLGWSVCQVFDNYSSMLLDLFVFPADFDPSQLQHGISLKWQ